MFIRNAFKTIGSKTQVHYMLKTMPGLTITIFADELSL